MTTMKKFLIASATFLLLLFSAQESMSQVVVKVRPNRPARVIAKPTKARPGKAWVAGHWSYNRRAQKYQWTKGHWVKARPGKCWVPGHWKDVPGGHNWIPGHWKPC